MTYTFSKQAQILFDALIKNGVEAKSEYWDGHKHIDIAIPKANLYIEVDGLHHYMNPKQIEADLKRDHFSDGDDFDTIRIPNLIIDNYLEKVVQAIITVVNNRVT